MTWLQTNIFDRLTNPNLDFQVTIKKSNFEKVPFDDAANNAAREIASLTSKKLFVAFSGGYDSEFIVRRLHALKIDFVPVIVEMEGHEFERSFAYKTLMELGIRAKFLKLSRKDYVKIYYDQIVKKLNGSMWACIHVYASQYVDSENGAIIFGTHIGGIGSRPLLENNRERIIQQVIDSNDTTKSFVNEQIYFFREYDYYCSALFPNLSVYDFFTQTPQIATAMLDEVNGKDFLWEDYKERVYKIRYRPKTKDYFSPEMRDVLFKIKLSRKYSPNDSVYVGNKDELRNLIVY